MLRPLQVLDPISISRYLLSGLHQVWGSSFPSRLYMVFFTARRMFS